MYENLYACNGTLTYHCSMLYTADSETCQNQRRIYRNSKGTKNHWLGFDGGGTIAVIIGSNNSAHAFKKPDAKGLAVTGIGLLSGLIGLPLLISGDNMAKKAKHMEVSS